MHIAKNTPHRKSGSRSRHYQPTTEASPIAVRFILDRFDVSPSLAATIATLAMLGGRA